MMIPTALALALPSAAAVTAIHLFNSFTEPLNLDASSNDVAVPPGAARVKC